MTDSTHVKLLIVGSGPAGYTAAVYGARAMLDPMLIQGMQPGGQLTITTEVENWPGETEIQGPDLMVKMEEHARQMGTDIVTDMVTRLDLQQRPFVAECDSGKRVTADAVILATGAQARWLGLPSEEIQGLWRQRLRDLRRFLLSQSRGSGDRRRQYRRGRGAVPDEIRQQGNAGASP